LSGAVILLDHGNAGQSDPEFAKIHAQMPKSQHKATSYIMACATIDRRFRHDF
jgi:hypothetical protein